MGIVVFLVGPGPGEIHGALSIGEVPYEVEVEEFGAVIAIEGKQGEREFVFDIMDTVNNLLGAFVPDGTAFCPSGIDIGHGEAPDEITGKAVAAMSYRIGLHVTGLCDIPVAGAYRDLVAQHGRGLGPAHASAVASLEDVRHGLVWLD